MTTHCRDESPHTSRVFSFSMAMLNRQEGDKLCISIRWQNCCSWKLRKNMQGFYMKACLLLQLGESLEVNTWKAIEKSSCLLVILEHSVIIKKELKCKREKDWRWKATFCLTFKSEDDNLTLVNPFLDLDLRIKEQSSTYNHIIVHTTNNFSFNFLKYPKKIQFPKRKSLDIQRFVFLSWSYLSKH